MDLHSVSGPVVLVPSWNMMINLSCGVQVPTYTSSNNADESAVLFARK